MIAAVRFEDGDYGLRAVLTSTWSDVVGAEISHRACVEMEMNHAKGWKGNDLSFLVRFPKLKSLRIIDFTIPSVEPIHVLHELQALRVMTYCRTEIDFSSFPMLEDCGLEWRPGAESLFDCVMIKKVFVNRYSGKDVRPFAQLVNLESLAILNAPIEDLYGLGALKHLRDLRLANLKKLRSLAGIEGLMGLEELEIHTCRGITMIDKIGCLSCLRRLYLNNDGNISSLKPLDKLDKLESVLFYESTNILDGDLSPLMRQKSLSRVTFQNRRHYSHRREEFGAAYST